MKDKLLKQTRYIDSKNGTFTEKQTWVDMQFNDNGYLFFRNKKAIKSYIDLPLPNSLSWSDKGRIAALQHYILKDNQLLVYRGSNAIKPLNVDMIAKVVGLSGKRCKQFIKELKQNDIIREINIAGTTYYCFNPLYGMKDKRLTLTVFIVFQDVLRDKLPQWAYNKFLEQASEIKPNITILK